MNFKKISKPLILGLSGLMLAACGGDTDTQDAGGETENGETTLRVTVWDYAANPEFEALFSAYEDENPDITIEPIDITSGDYDQRLTTMLAGGDETDVLSMKGLTAYPNYASTGQLMDLTEYAAEIDNEDFQSTIDLMSVDDSVYALPYRNDFYVLFYNKDIFDEAGVDYPGAMTWDEYSELALDLTSGEGNDKIYGAYNHTWNSIIQSTAVGQIGGGADAFISGDYEFVKPIYEVFLGMEEEGSSMEYSIANSTGTSYSSQFETESAAMLPMGSWYIAALSRSIQEGDADFNWGIAPLPNYESTEEIVTWGSPTSLAVNNNAANPEAAIDFVTWAAGEEAAKILAEAAVVPAYRTDEINEIYFNNEGMPNDEIAELAFNPEIIHLELPPHKAASSVNLILSEEHGLIMLGENSVDEGIEVIENRVSEEIDTSE